MSFLKNVFSKQKIPSVVILIVARISLQACPFNSGLTRAGQGVMVINANNVLHLNHTATAFAYFFMQGMPKDEVVKKIRRMYRVNADKTQKRIMKNLSTQSARWRKQKKSTPLPILKLKKKNPLVTNIQHRYVWIWL